jgi:predicted NACHT family NTPase
MVKRSIQASPTGIQLAKRGFAIKGWTQENLAGEVNLKTRQPIWRFFTGQSVDRQIFIEICSVLDLDWREIALDPPAEFPGMGKIAELPTFDINELVEQVNSHRCAAIQAQCGCVHLLEIARPIGIEDIYVDLYVTDRITSQQWRTLGDLQAADLAEFTQPGTIDSERCYRIGSIDRTANRDPATNPQIASLQTVDTYSKLRVLGQMGSGKTTFLQHLAIECDRGNSGRMGIGATESEPRVPILLALRDFAEESQANGKFSLLNYIQQRFFSTELLNPLMLETLLQAGRVLLLLDGLDEVLDRDSAAVGREIRKFSEKYYQNQFVVTCRTAARKRQLHGFTDVEIAVLTPAQIVSFADKWFGAVAHSNTHASILPWQIEFVRKLDSPENRQFRQLTTTPLFLHLACSIFHGQYDSPTQQVAFYKQGLDLLLGKWDEAKGIDRQNLPRSLSLPQKLRLLSQLATVTFEQDRYLFDRWQIEQHIGDYLQSLPEIDWEPEELQLESEAILDSLASADGILTERSQGIFSFSYLAFPAYFTARKIVSERDPQGLASALNRLVAHLTDPRWREVFLLVATMLRNADLLVQLIKQQIDRLIDRDPYLQEFLQWTNQTSPLLPISSKVTPARVFPLAAVQPAHQLVGVATASEHRRPNHLTNVHPVWQFSPEQQQLLQAYYYSTQLLIDCLDRNPQVTISRRQEIEATLMLTPPEPNNRNWQADYLDARTVGEVAAAAESSAHAERFPQRLSS